jgi:HK97 family phage portal protein
MKILQRIANVFRPRASGIDRNASQWLVGSIAGGKSKAGIDVGVNESITYSAVWAAVRILAQTIASLSWHVHERMDDGRKLVAADHPVDWLIHREPNMDMSSLSSLMPIHSSRVETKRNEMGELYYHVHQGASNERRIVVPDMMFHVKGVGDGVLGYFLVRLAKESFGLGLATETFGATWFGNGSRAGGLLKHPAKLDKKSRDNLAASWRAIHGEPENWNNLAVLEEGMDFVTTSVPPEDAQFLQTRTFQIDEVSRWLGVPPHMLAELSRGTFSNIEHQAIEFVRYSLRPWVNRWETEADRKLFGDQRLRNSAFFTKMNLDVLLRGDKKAQGEFYRTMITNGVFSINEVRALEDMNPLGPEGDKHVIQQNMTTLEKIGETIKPPPPLQLPPLPAKQDDKQERIEWHKKSHCRTFADAAGRIIGKEARAAKRAVLRCKGDADKFSAWLGTFYDEHGDQGGIDAICQTLSPPAESLAETIAVERGADGLPPAVSDAITHAVRVYADQHIETSRTELAEAFSSGSVGDLCDLWLHDRPPAIAVQLTDQTAQAVQIITSET